MQQVMLKGCSRVLGLRGSFNSKQIREFGFAAMATFPESVTVSASLRDVPFRIGFSLKIVTDS